MKILQDSHDKTSPSHHEKTEKEDTKIIQKSLTKKSKIGRRTKEKKKDEEKKDRSREMKIAKRKKMKRDKEEKEEKR